MVENRSSCIPSIVPPRKTSIIHHNHHIQEECIDENDNDDDNHHNNHHNNNNHNHNHSQGGYHLVLTPSEEETMKHYNNNSFHMTHVLLRCRSEMMAPNFRKSREVKETKEVGEERKCGGGKGVRFEKGKKNCSSCHKSNNLSVKPLLSRRMGKLKLR